MKTPTPPSRTFVPKTFHFKLLSITATVLLAVGGVVVSVHSSNPQASSEEPTDARSGAKVQERQGESKTSHSKAPTLTVSGGITLNSAFQPLLFTWNSAVTVQGSHWQPGETVSIILQGPLNSLAVAANLLSLGPLSADANGNFSASVPIPFDSGIVGQSARIPRPGHYQVQAVGSASGIIIARQEIDLCSGYLRRLRRFRLGSRTRRSGWSAARLSAQLLTGKNRSGMGGDVG
jgi:hypothetical protein